MRYFALIVWVSLLSAGLPPRCAEGQNSCLAYFDTMPQCRYEMFGNGRFLPGNPDSVLVDTCTGSSTYGLFYIRWGIGLDVRPGIFNIPLAPADTIIDLSWQVIDSSYTSVRAAFAAIEAKYGSFLIRKTFPAWDTNNRYFTLHFSNYVCLDSAILMFDSTLDTTPYFVSGPVLGLQTPLAIADDNKSRMQNYHLYPNPGNAVVRTSETLTDVKIFDALGREVRSIPFVQQEIDISDLRPGTYQVFSREGIFPLIVQR